MADTITLNPGAAGAVLATDDIGGVHYPIQKLAIGALDSATLLDGNSGNKSAGTIRVVLATDQPALTNKLLVTPDLPSGAATDAKLDTIITHVDGLEALIGTTNTNTAATTTSVQLIDDAVQVLGTDTYTEATSKGLTLGAVRRDADTTLVDTTNEFGPLQMDANGRLKVEAFSGEALPVTLTSTTVTGTVAVTQSGTWDEVGINDSGNSITVDWAGTAPPIGAGLEATALRVTVATDSTGVLSVDDNGSTLSIDDGGGIITVDGTVAVTNGGLTELAAAINASSQMDVNIAANGIGLATSAKQDTIIGHVDGIEALLAGTLTVTGGGGGVEYTEGDTDATIVGSVAMMEVAADTLQPIQGTVAGGLLVNLGANNDVTVTGTVDLGATDNAVLDAIAASVAAIDTDTTTIIGHVDGIEALLGTIDADTGSILTSVQLIDDTVQVLGTDTYTEATSKGITLGAVRRDADTTLVNTTNEFGPLQMDANGRLKVEVFSGEALPVTLTSTTVTGTVAVTQSGTWDEVGINDSGNSITVDYATTGSGTATGALRVELPTNGTGVVGLNAGTNAIGKLAANSGVDIGDVDVTSISAGTNNIGNVGLIGRTTGGMTIFKSIDLDESEEEVKATAGQVFSISAFNHTAAPLFLKFYNLTAANTTVGSSTPVATFTVPGNADSDGAGFVWNNPIGLAFGTAISAAVTTAIADADTGAPAANACSVVIGYV